MLWGVLAVAAVTAVLAIVLWAVLYGEATRLFLRRHRPAPPAPAGPPIEALAADLTRLRRATLSVQPGTSHTRRSATLAAYDDTLVQACHALGLPDTLSELRAGTDREAERLRVEALLEAAGLRFTSSR